ncbi:unnamed protein product [Cochlearia groenlandica]
MDPSKRRTAKEVGDRFVQEYYQVMKNSPTMLHDAYRPDSKIGRPEHLYSVVMRFFTLVDVGEKLNMFTYGRFESAKITTVMSQDSQNASVIIHVGGYFASKEESHKRSFTQVFILAAQENGYFVANDMFRFDDGDMVTSTANKETKVSPKEDDADGSLRVSEPNNDRPESSSKIAEGSDVMKAVPKVKAQYMPSDTFHNPNINDDEFEEPDELFESSAIYINNLPLDHPFGQVETAFSMFGTIKKIEIRREALGHCYAFVEFEDANAAMWALQTSYLWIARRKVYIKKKRVQGYWLKKKAYEEEIRQYNQRRFEEECSRGREIYEYWKFVKSMEEFGDLQEQYKGSKAYDFWKWQRSVSMLHRQEVEEEEQSEPEEEEEQMELDEEKEQRKLKEEEQRKLEGEEKQRKLKEEEQKKLKEEEEEQRKLEEEEKQRKLEEEEKQRKLEEEEKQRKLEEEQEQKMLKEEQEQKKLKEEEEEEQRKLEEEEKERKRVEEEKQRKNNQGRQKKKKNGGNSRRKK